MKTKGYHICAALIGIILLPIFSSEGLAVDDMPKFFMPKPVSSENFPCSKCHNYRSADRKKRKLKLAHTNIDLRHAGNQRWCLDCHEGDKLRLSNGELVSPDKSYLLCGQCHGTKFKDWKAGVHGKTVGTWNGDRLYYICVSCHDPHQPKFRQIEPKQPPMRPEQIN